MKIVVSVLFILMLIAGSGAFADDVVNSGTGQSGVTVSLGYDGAHMHYGETVNDKFLDKDTGWLNGGICRGKI